MKKQNIFYYLVLIGFISLICLNTSSAQSNMNFTFDHQDPAGDVLKYNATVNGTPVEGDPAIDALDIKWVRSQADGQGNILLTMDLKAKNKFVNENETKYVFRILTNFDNSTGYNITYRNHDAILVPFSPQGNGTPVNIFTNVSFIKDQGDEMMVISISILTYLDDIYHFGLDAFSMKILDNATFLDYISELPGHPEYVNPEVEAGENLEDEKDGNGEEKNDEDASIIPWLVIIIIIILLIIIMMVWFAKKRKRST